MYIYIYILKGLKSFRKYRGAHMIPTAELNFIVKELKETSIYRFPVS